MGKFFIILIGILGVCGSVWTQDAASSFRGRAALDSFSFAANADGFQSLFGIGVINGISTQRAMNEDFKDYSKKLILDALQVRDVDNRSIWVILPKDNGICRKLGSSYSRNATAAWEDLNK